MTCIDNKLVNKENEILIECLFRDAKIIQIFFGPSDMKYTVYHWDHSTM